MSYDTIQGKQKEYFIPKNCSKLSVPGCNDEIWKKLSRFQKRKDVKMANVQRVLSASATAITQVIENLLSASKDKTTMDIPAIVSKVTDALALMGHASHEVSFRRWEMLAHTLKRKYAGLASPAVPVTDFLFSDDLLKTMRDIHQSSTISREAGQSQWSKTVRASITGEKRGHPGSTKNRGTSTSTSTHSNCNNPCAANNPGEYELNDQLSICDRIL